MPISSQAPTCCFRRPDTTRVHVQPHMCMSSPACICSFARQIANNERYSPAYKRHSRRFRSERGCPSHPVVGSKSFAYFLISLHSTSFMAPNGCPCLSSSTCFFKPPRPPPRAACTGEVWITSSSLPSNSSAPEFVAYPRLHKKTSLTNTPY